jgi:phytoene dehydrogenase-like protein
MATWDAIVIGSGLGGLGAAARYARSGKRVLVLERLSNFGGCATTWRHGKLTMEASLHETDGGEIFSEHGTFRQLGVTDKVEPIATDLFYEVRSKLFEAPIRVPHGLAPAESVLSAALPQAQAGLARYFRSLRLLHGALEDLGDLGQKGPGVFVGMLFSGRLFELISEMRMTVSEGMRNFFADNEAPKLALCPHLCYFDDNPDKMSLLGFSAITAQFIESGSYYLRGGSRTLTHALLHVIKDAGGEARHNRTVTEIILDAEGRAAGVRHMGADGSVEEDYAEEIFGNAAPALLAEMLPPDHQEPFKAAYATMEPSISLFTVALGLDRPAAEFGVSAYSTFIYPDWMERLDQYPVTADVFGAPPAGAMPFYGVTDYASLDPKLGPDDDLYAVSMTGVDRLWAWEGLSAEEDKARREAWIDALVNDLDARYPGIRGAVRQAEMATARTLKNRIGTPNGECYGWRPTPERLFGRPPTPRTTVPGLWISSAYTVSGGYAGALHGGMLAAQAALGDSRKRRDRTRRRSTVFG